ncbi:MAG: glucose-6-phosphate isomerase [Spirochaetes bacterium]|jgi:glucose-6-phosphate isomerase|nr:glucose-6-phosphate isomerase [Spirochaetota bacterium]
MADITYRNLDSADAVAHLRDLAPPTVADLDVERIESSDIPAAEGLRFNYAATPTSVEVVNALGALAGEQQLIEKYHALLDGEVMNTGEDRMVLHHLTRGQLGNPVRVQEQDKREFYTQQQSRIADFARAVHSERITGSTGKPFDTVVQIGIGGSDLGPRAMYLALQNYVAGTGEKPKLEAYFISNVDPDDAGDVISAVDPETTLFILVSKSGTTQETLTNEAFVIEKMRERDIRGLNPRSHMVAVTSETSPLARSGEYLDAFFIDDYIGGRYSSTSAVGGCVLSLAFGPEVFEEFLAGAHAGDRAALEPDIRANAILMDAMIGVYERNVLGYSQALSRFPAHLQQLDMESNGKSVNRDGARVPYPTGPLVFGEPGTNGQHSFYQLLHQGTDIIPLQFLGFRQSQRGEDVEFDHSASQTKLVANLVAQIVAFAMGKSDENPNKNFEGNRPSTLLYGERLTPRVLGALLSHYENKVMFQGFAWNINSFDQEGVQLGKKLTKEVLGGNPGAELAAYGRLLGLK